jgi:hypothetical protein
MYYIVKHAGRNWDFYWKEDPKATGVSRKASAHRTHSGRSIGIKSEYPTKSAAEKDCKLLNDFNPVGDYAVCHGENHD